MRIFNKMEDRKALKAFYKHQAKRMGVYQIRNLTNHKILVGSSTDLDALWNRHKAELGMGVHRIRDLQQDWNDTGASNFAFEVLEIIEQEPDSETDYRRELKKAKERHIEALNPYDDKGYHQRPKS